MSLPPGPLATVQRLVGVVAALCLFAACGSTTEAVPMGAGGQGGEGGAPPIASCSFGDNTSAAGVCAEMACVACGAEASCDPFGFSVRWASDDECRSRTVALCEKQLAAPGVRAPLESFSACAKDKAGLTCADYLAERWPLSCTLTPGDVPEGGPCGFDAQCAPGFCFKEFNSSDCGVCRAPKALDTCNEHNTSCGPGLRCVGGMCLPFGGAGADCSGLNPCEPTLVCDGGACASPHAEGGACQGAFPDDVCDRRHGLACDSLSMTCKAIPVVGTGSPCGQLASTDPTSDVFPVCGPASSCIVHDSPPGSCEARPADGASCDQPDPTASAKSCRPPALCVGGACTIADPASCG